LKAVLFSLTNVPPERQKIVGLTKGKLPGDEQAVVKLGLGPGASSKPKEFMMMYASLLPRANHDVGVR
jgi:ubiquitin-like domain-containing CTD phosphatase 1